MSIDRNYYSIHGDPDGTLWITEGDKDPVKIRDGLLPVYEIPELFIDLPRDGIDSSQFSDIFKLSHTHNLHIGRLVVMTGGHQRENAADFNFECSNVIIDAAILEEGNQNAWTCKGGCSAVKFGSLLIYPSHRAHCNVELGNFSAQSTKKTHDIKIGLIGLIGGGEVQIRVDYASRPQIGQGNVHYQWLEGFIIDLWVRLRLLFS